MTQWITTNEAWAHVAFYERDKAQDRIFAKLIEGKLLSMGRVLHFRPCRASGYPNAASILGCYLDPSRFRIWESNAGGF